jgi:vacuolar protein sorting-associated protein 16
MVYDMLWGSMDFKKYNCAIAPFGGPIALILNEKRIVSYQGYSAKPVMQIYSSSGKLLNQIQVEMID